MSSEASDVDAMIERMAREEQDDLDRAHGQHILNVTDYAKEREQDPLVQILRQAHQAKAEDDKE
jgi:hypothetical protein